MSKRKQATLGEFGFSKKVCHRDDEVDVIIPEFVEEKEIVSASSVYTAVINLWKKIQPQIVLKVAPYSINNIYTWRRMKN